MFDGVALEDIEGIHGSDAEVVRLMGEREALDLVCEYLRWSIVACCGDALQFRVGVGGLKGFCGAGAFAGILARHNLQVAPGMLIRRMPEEGRGPAQRGFANTVDGIAGDAQQRGGFGFGLPGSPPGAPWIRRFWHDKPHRSPGYGEASPKALAMRLKAAKRAAMWTASASCVSVQPACIVDSISERVMACESVFTLAANRSRARSASLGSSE